MTNLNLNISVSEKGEVIVPIFTVTAVNEQGNREFLGHYAQKKKAEEQLKFWTETMEYTHGRIDFEVLYLN